MSGFQYPEHFIERLHAVWGEGFLSPGGADEVAEIVRGLELRGKTVLDVGFGTAGPAMVLAGQCGAACVIGIDVEEPLLRRASALIEKAGLSEKVALRIVEPGPLPFDDESFDVVFSKDSIITSLTSMASSRKSCGSCGPADFLRQATGCAVPEHRSGRR
jgi:phosphoethanolamine N-methyltransferase